MLQQHSSRGADGHADERSSLLPTRAGSDGIEMETALNDVEDGYGGTSDGKSEYATSETTCSSLTGNTASTSTTNADDDDEESQQSSHETTKRHTWLFPFFANIFLACASFSIVMPSLAPYILHMGAPLSFLPWVVSAYSVGEMGGSVALGHFYEHATKTFGTPGRGPRAGILVSLFLGVVGSAMYAAAGWVEDVRVAKALLLLARLIQGVWTGGQQSIEQAYLSAAVDPSERTEYTATLSTCAVLGFVMGPSIGALLSQIDTAIFGLPVDADNVAGVFMFVATSCMFVQTALFFDGKDDTTGQIKMAVNNKREANGSESETANTTLTNSQDALFNITGVTMCMVIFYIHYYSFAVQETIITPMVMLLYGWDSLEVNLLFMGAGVLSLITAFAVRYLTRVVEDRTLLLASILIGFVGSVLLIDRPFSATLPVWRLLLGFGLITVAFPIGRNVVLGIYGTLLGEVNQGKWMGAIFAVSAFPRVVGPFVSLDLLKAVKWQTWLEFGICAVFFGLTLIATWRNLGDFAPLEAATEQSKENRLVVSHSPMPSPMLGSSPTAADRRERRR